MNNDDIWLMSDQSLQSLRKDIKEQKKIGTARQQMAFDDYRLQVGDTQVLRIHGPIISRPNWITDLLGLRTTEEHLDNLSDIIASGNDVLLDIDTGGGHASLAFELADMIRSGGEQVSAYSGGAAASAGMLFLTAAANSYAHRSATLGSIGVVAYGYFSEDDKDDGFIYSDNAQNKRPNRTSMRRDINETENLFIEYVERGTGLSREDIISLGRHGDIFTGEYADTNGFIDSTTTLQELTTQTEGGTLPQPKDMQAAMQAMATRFASCTSIEGVPSEIAQMVAGNLAIEDDAATSLLTAVGKACSTAYDAGMEAGNAKAKPADDDKGNQTKAPDQGAMMALLQQMQAALSKDVNSVKGDQTDGGDPPEEKTEAELNAEKFNNRLDFIRKHNKREAS
jgi:ClpP class serine protease